MPPVVSRPMYYAALCLVLVAGMAATAEADMASALSAPDTLDSRPPLIAIAYPAGGEVFSYTETETLQWTIDEQSWSEAPAPVSWSVISLGSELDQGDLVIETGGDYTVVWAVPPFAEAGTAQDAQLVVTASDRFGWTAADTSAVFELRDDVTDVPGIVLTDRLGRVMPNPFNPSTTISFSLEAPARVELAVFDMRGQRVATLYEGDRGAGEHSARWLGRGNDGRRVASGVYFARLRIDGTDRDNSFVTRLTLVK